MIASIVDDNRCGMSDVAFCTATPIGWRSCFEQVVVEQCHQLEGPGRENYNSQVRLELER